MVVVEVVVVLVVLTGTVQRSVAVALKLLTLQQAVQAAISAAPVQVRTTTTSIM